MKNVLVLMVFFLLCVGGKSQEVTGDWYGTIEFPGARLRLVFHISEQGGKWEATLDSPDQGAKGIPATQVSYNAPALELQFASIKAEYKAILKEGKLKGTFTQMNIPISVDLQREEIKRKRPQEPLPPYPYHNEEVIFENPEAGISLAGTLTLPRENGRFPAVVLISGSGAQNRDEELMGHKPFLVLADYLTRQGIAVLRFDDREVGQSGGVFAQATTLDFATDVAAAVNYLKNRKEILSSAIGLVGHSEGGAIAPVVAAEDPDIAFIVLLAGMGIPGQELLLQQNADLMKAGKVPAAYQEKTQEINRKIYGILLTSPEAQARRTLDSIFRAELPFLTKGQALTPQQQDQFVQQQMMSIMTPWFREFLAFRPQEYLSRVKCPVLALNGEKDLQVNARQNLTTIYRALHESGNQAVDTVYLADLNHLFQTCPTGLPGEYAQIEETFSPRALKVISDWILKILRRT